MGVRDTERAPIAFCDRPEDPRAVAVGDRKCDRTEERGMALTTMDYRRPAFNEPWPRHFRFAVVYERATQTFSVYDREMLYVVRTTRNYDEAADHAEALQGDV